MEAQDADSTADNNDTPDRVIERFLALPGELRTRVYDHFFNIPTKLELCRVHQYSFRTLSVLANVPQLKDETSVHLAEAEDAVKRTWLTIDVDPFLAFDDEADPRTPFELKRGIDDTYPLRQRLEQQVAQYHGWRLVSLQGVAYQNHRVRSRRKGLMRLPTLKDAVRQSATRAPTRSTA